MKYRQVNILLAEEEIKITKEYKQMLINDIDHEIEINLMDGKQFPLYQTEAYLYVKYMPKWHEVFDQYYKIIASAGFGDYKIVKAWANVTKPGSDYSLHNHEEAADISLIHYLQVPNNDYGTCIYLNDAPYRIGGIEGTAVLFDSSLYHEMQMVPDELLKDRKNWRYTIVLDLRKGEFPDTRRVKFY